MKLILPNFFKLLAMSSLFLLVGCARTYYCDCGNGDVFEVGPTSKKVANKQCEGYAPEFESGLDECKLR